TAPAAGLQDVPPRGTAAIILNTPCHNATGHALTRADWQRIKAVVWKHADAGKHVCLVINTAYLDYYWGRPVSSACASPSAPCRQARCCHGRCHPHQQGRRSKVHLAPVNKIPPAGGGSQATSATAPRPAPTRRICLHGRGHGCRD